MTTQVNHIVDASGIDVVNDVYNSDEVSPLSLRLSRRTVRGASNRKALPSLFVWSIIVSCDEVNPLSFRLSRRIVIGTINRKALPSLFA